MIVFFMASYYRQIFADIEMKNYKILSVVFAVGAECLWLTKLI